MLPRVHPNNPEALPGPAYRQCRINRLEALPVRRPLDQQIVDFDTRVTQAQTVITHERAFPSQGRFHHIVHFREQALYELSCSRAEALRRHDTARMFWLPDIMDDELRNFESSRACISLESLHHFHASKIFRIHGIVHVACRLMRYAIASIREPLLAPVLNICLSDLLFEQADDQPLSALSTFELRINPFGVSQNVGNVPTLTEALQHVARLVCQTVSDQGISSENIDSVVQLWKVEASREGLHSFKQPALALLVLMQRAFMGQVTPGELSEVQRVIQEMETGSGSARDYFEEIKPKVWKIILLRMTQQWVRSNQMQHTIAETAIQVSGVHTDSQARFYNIYETVLPHLRRCVTERKCGITWVDSPDTSSSDTLRSVLRNKLLHAVDEIKLIVLPSEAPAEHLDHELSLIYPQDNVRPPMTLVLVHSKPDELVHQHLQIRTLFNKFKIAVVFLVVVATRCPQTSEYTAIILDPPVPQRPSRTDCIRLTVSPEADQRTQISHTLISQTPCQPVHWPTQPLPELALQNGSREETLITVATGKPAGLTTPLPIRLLYWDEFYTRAVAEVGELSAQIEFLRVQRDRQQGFVRQFSRPYMAQLTTLAWAMLQEGADCTRLTSAQLAATLGFAQGTKKKATLPTLIAIHAVFASHNSDGSFEFTLLSARNYFIAHDVVASTLKTASLQTHFSVDSNPIAQSFLPPDVLALVGERLLAEASSTDNYINFYSVWLATVLRSRSIWCNRTGAARPVNENPADVPQPSELARVDHLDLMTLVVLSSNCFSLLASAPGDFVFAGRDFKRCSIDHAILGSSDLTACIFTDAFLTGCDFSVSKISEANFTRAHLEQTKFGHLKVRPLDTVLDQASHCALATSNRALVLATNTNGLMIYAWPSLERHFVTTLTAPAASICATWNYTTGCDLIIAATKTGLLTRYTLDARFNVDQFVAIDLNVSGLRDMACSADGGRIITLSLDGHLRSHAGQPLAVTAQMKCFHKGESGLLAVDQEATLIALASGSSVRLFRLGEQSFDLQQTLNFTDMGSIHSVALSSEQNWRLLIGGEAGAHLVECNGRRTLLRSAATRKVSFSRDYQSLYTLHGSDLTIRCWSSANLLEEPLKRIRTYERTNTFLIGADEAYVFDGIYRYPLNARIEHSMINRSSLFAQLQNVHEPIHLLAASADKRFLASAYSLSTEHAVHVWNLVTRERSVPVHTPLRSRIAAIAFAPAQTLLVVGTLSHGLMLFREYQAEVGGTSQWTLCGELAHPPSQGSLQSIYFDAHQRLILVLFERALLSFDMDTLAERQALSSANQNPQQFAFSSTNTTIMPGQNQPSTMVYMSYNGVIQTQVLDLANPTLRSSVVAISSQPPPALASNAINYKDLRSQRFVLVPDLASVAFVGNWSNNQSPSLFLLKKIDRNASAFFYSHQLEYAPRPEIASFIAGSPTHQWIAIRDGLNNIAKVYLRPQPHTPIALVQTTREGYLNPTPAMCYAAQSNTLYWGEATGAINSKTMGDEPIPGSRDHPLDPQILQARAQGRSEVAAELRKGRIGGKNQVVAGDNRQLAPSTQLNQRFVSSFITFIPPSALIGVNKPLYMFDCTLAIFDGAIVAAGETSTVDALKKLSGERSLMALQSAMLVNDSFIGDSSFHANQNLSF